ncbi:MAG: hypothetical protein QM708_10535 [Propioniciclava sp.]
MRRVVAVGVVSLVSILLSGSVGPQGFCDFFPWAPGCRPPAAIVR